MGTRADFYVGRGKDAEWLGSIAWDGYPDGIPKKLLKSTDETTFRHNVTKFLNDREDKSLPEDGWPWPWDNSKTTDYAYAFDGTQVYGSCFGSVWFEPLNKLDENDDYIPSDNPPKKTNFPNMKNFKRRPVFGAHSGVILVSAPVEEI